MLRISNSLSLPLDAITQTFGVLAVRGAGKTNAARVMAEEMHGAGLPFVAVDPVGSWWGLRSSADGKGAGIPVPIFGGRRGDVPLERGGGNLVADLVADKRLSAILDVSDFSEGDKVRFLTDFADRLYRRNSAPLHLFLEEADDYIPQRPMRDQARCLRAWENIVRRGRARGLGVTLITQRSAAINKMVLTQCETLFVLRTTSPQDRAAVEAWIKYHAVAADVLKTLPELLAGEAWVWSPQWLKLAEPKRIRFRLAHTFDSGATPKVSREARPPAALADVDLDAVRRAMADTIERAKAEDPRELKREIAALRKQLAASERAQPPAPEAKVERVEVPVVDRDVAERLIATAESMVGAIGTLAELRGQLDARAVEIQAAAQRLSVPHETAPSRLAVDRPRAAPAPAMPTPAPTRPAPVRSPEARADSNGKVTAPQQRILDALAWLESIRPGAAPRGQLAFLAEQSPKSSGYANNLGALRTAGLIDYPAGGAVELTAEGRGLAEAPPLAPTAEDVQRRVLERVSAPQQRILRALIDSYPEPIERTALAEQSEQSPASSGFANNLGFLRSLGVIDYPAGGLVVAREILFL